MNSKWVFRRLSSHVSPRSSLAPPLRAQTFPDASSQASTFVLDNVHVSRLLSTCGREGRFLLGSSLHASIIKNPELHDLGNEDLFRNGLVVWNSLLSMYAKCGDMLDVVKLFDEMPAKDTISWNTALFGFLRNGEFEMCCRTFKRMWEGGVQGVDKATVTTILSGCDTRELSRVVELVHGIVFRGGFQREVTIGNALITSYFKCGGIDWGLQVFNEMFERNVISWTAVIFGLQQNEFFEDSLKLFMSMRSGSLNPNTLTYLSSIMSCSGLQAINVGRQLHSITWKLGIQSDLLVESALMDMYAKCGSLEDALDLFESAETIDEVSMTVILVGFAQNGFEEQAIQMFLKMVKEGLEIDSNVVSAVLGVFGVDTSLGLGKQIHSLIIKRSFSHIPFVSNGLINMYAKCGDIVESLKVFSRLPSRNLISWNSMVNAFACHGGGYGALQLYEEMKMEGVKPTDVTFLSLLHACSHIGLVKEGMEVLDSMEREYGISPRTEHYACVVDMLGRAGRLAEAKSFIEGMPTEPGVLVWQALLGACSMHSDSEIGRYAAEQLISAAPETPAPYISLANIYSAEGDWKERARTIKRMKEAGVTKETGISSIEIEKKVHSFVVRDRMHTQSEIIFEVIKELFPLMTDEGYTPDKIRSLFLDAD
ncbi:pentatricopeptide repeat-containing protein At3g05340 [Rhodamnia argentea]|uniref:Pentatricopeptide repeat-containing protein At3g05340 n=1 Tax=Rhodamnia argentea TaxID=178133 RepID=A0A8B8PJ76_9MYRT|nr:pentatricopeptide repeat-containing protein At3g05340 [Rhodamnia argentea]